MDTFIEMIKFLSKSKKLWLAQLILLIMLIGILSTTPNISVIVKGDKSLNKRDISESSKL